MRDQVGIVLVNYNGMKFMPDCLQSLAKIDYPQARVVIVDNASADGSADWAAMHFPEIAQVRHAGNLGITGGNNAGIAWCRENGCGWVLLLNNDTVVEPDFLSRLLDQNEPNCLLVPKIYFYDNKSVINNHLGSYDYWRGLHVDWFYGRPDSPASREVTMVTMANTCALLMRLEAAERVGLMDDSYFIYYDDTDFLTRAVRGGALIKFVPDAVVYHRESSSSGGGDSPLSVYYLNRNRLYFMFKNQKNRLALVFFLFYFALTRLVKIAGYRRNGQSTQIRALRNAVADFRRGRMGQASSSRFQP